MKALYFDADSVDRFSRLLLGNGCCFITPSSWHDLMSAQDAADVALSEGLISSGLSLGFSVDSEIPTGKTWDEAFIGIQCSSLDDARCVAIEICAGANFFAAFGENWRSIREALASAICLPSHENSVLGTIQKGNEPIRNAFRISMDFSNSFDSHQVWSLTDVTGQERPSSEYVITGSGCALDRIHDLLMRVDCEFESEFRFGGTGELKFLNLPEWIADWPSVVEHGFDIPRP